MPNCMKNIDKATRTACLKQHVSDFLIRPGIDEMPFAGCSVDIEEHLDHKHHVDRVAIGGEWHEQHLGVPFRLMATGREKQAFRIERPALLYALIIKCEYMRGVIGAGQHLVEKTSGGVHPVSASILGTDQTVTITPIRMPLDQ